MTGIFSETQTAGELWTLGQGRHVCGVLNLSRIFNSLRASHFAEDKIGQIQSWERVPVVGTPIYM